MRRSEHRGQGELDGAFVTLTPVVGQSKDLEDAFDFVRLNRPSKGPFREPGDHLAGTIEPRLIAVFGRAKQDPPMRLGKLHPT